MDHKPESNSLLMLDSRITLDPKQSSFCLDEICQTVLRFSWTSFSLLYALSSFLPAYNCLRNTRTKEIPFGGSEGEKGKFRKENTDRIVH